MSDNDETTNTFIGIAASSIAPTVPVFDEDEETFLYDRPLTDAEWLAQVQSRALDLTVMSYQSHALQVVANALSGVDKKRWKTFTATILDVTKEKSSTRGKLELKTRPSDRNKEGIEYVRTGRTDSSQSARDLANKAVALIGHRVQLFVELEEKSDGSGESVRILHHLIDLGAVGDE